MNFFKRKFRKQTATSMYSFIEPTTPMSPTSNVLDNVEEDEIDYLPCIQQEEAGIHLQKNERLMIEELNANVVRWSAEHKRWLKKWNCKTKKKEADFQPYTTTLNVFLTTILSLNQIAEQFDESSKKLDKVLEKVPKSENPSIKVEIAGETSTLKKAKHAVDDLEKKQKQLKSDQKRNQENLGKCPLNTPKRTKLQIRQESLKQQHKQLKKDIKQEEATYRQAQEQYRTNMEKIYHKCQKTELDRLTDVIKLLENLITAFNIDSTSLQKAIKNHDPAADLTSWQEKHFSPSFKQTAV